jgi:Mg-chelatase subunit ChlI
VIWLNGAVGSGKTAVAQAIANMLPRARFVDGDDFAGACHVPADLRWQMALNALLHFVARSGSPPILLVAYALRIADSLRARATCAQARRALVVVNLATPLPITLRGRGGRHLDLRERARAREMRSEGYHGRRFAKFTLANGQGSAARTARMIVRLTRSRYRPAC